MYKCYICDSSFQKTVTNYPDGKNPCPRCVETYRSYDQGSDTEEGEVETAPLEVDSDLESALHDRGVYNLSVDPEY